MADLRLNEARVLLALKCSTRPLNTDEIAAATAFDTPSGTGITVSTVRKALDGVPKSDSMHESTGYDGLLKRGFVRRVGNGYQISLPDPRPGPGSAGKDADEE